MKCQKGKQCVKHSPNDLPDNRPYCTGCDASVKDNLGTDNINLFTIAYKAVLIEVEEMSKKLDIYSFIVRRKSRVVAVEHCDGSYLEFHSACYRKLNKEWHVVFTEHHGSHVYHKDDVLKIKEWVEPKSLYFNSSDVIGVRE